MQEENEQLSIFGDELTPKISGSHTVKPKGALKCRGLLAVLAEFELVFQSKRMFLSKSKLVRICKNLRKGI